MPFVRRLAVFSTLAVAALTACSSDETTNAFAPLALSLTLSPTPDTLFVSDSIELAGTARLNVAASSLNSPVQTPSGIEWSSSDPSVASVSGDGTITPHSVGTTTITARVNNSKATADVVVTYRATKLQLSATSLAGIAGDTIAVTASALDPKGSLVPGTSYVFTSADPTVASVTTTGPRTARILLLKSGAANVRVTAGGQSATLTGTVQVRDFISSAVAGAPTGSLVLSAGTDVTCGLIALGRGYCFGVEPVVGIAKDTSCFSSAGTTTTRCSLIPLRIAGALNLVSVTVGDSVACGASADNHLYCWGSQQFGQLGNGVSTTGTSTIPSLVLAARSTNAEPILRASAGGNHVCGLTPSGVAYCWGRDHLAQLGNGDALRVNSSTPVPVAGGNVFASISSGHDHACALTPGGAAFCWGSNLSGQLGVALTDTVSDVPVAVGGGFSQISSGFNHTCALNTAGLAFCWGDNSAGELGDANNSGSQSFAPVEVAGGLRFKSISAGRFTTCGITTGGAAYCWGDNSFWQLGTSAGANSSVPSPVSGGHTDFSSVTVGARHVCATPTGGGAFCWGSNVFGALGNELQAMRQASPTRVIFP